MKKYIKNISVLYLIYSIIFTSTAVFGLNLGKTVSGWASVSVTRQGATSVYQATRAMASGLSVASTASMFPTVSEVTSLVLRGTAWGAVAAAAGLLYQGYEWAEDYLNNRIKGTPVNNTHPEVQYRWRHPTITTPYVYGLSDANGVAQTYFNNLKIQNPSLFSDLQFQSCSWFGVAYNSTIHCTAKKTSTNAVYGTDIVKWDNNPAYLPNYVPNTTPIYVPLDTVSQKIIDMANQGNAEAQALTNAVNDESWSDTPLSPAQQAKLLNQLNSNAQYPSDTQASFTTTGIASSTNPNSSGTTTTASSSNTTQTLPAFCNYASKLCDWLNWTQELPDKEPNGALPVIIPNINPDTQDRFIVNATCPAPYTFVAFGRSISVSYQPFCNLMEGVKPFVIGLSYLYAVYIIAGIKQQEGA